MLLSWLDGGSLGFCSRFSFGRSGFLFFVSAPTTFWDLGSQGKFIWALGSQDYDMIMEINMNKAPKKNRNGKALSPSQAFRPA